MTLCHTDAAGLLQNPYSRKKIETGIKRRITQITRTSWTLQNKHNLGGLTNVLAWHIRLSKKTACASSANGFRAIRFLLRQLLATFSPIEIQAVTNLIQRKSQAWHSENGCNWQLLHLRLTTLVTDIDRAWHSQLSSIQLWTINNTESKQHGYHKTWIPDYNTIGNEPPLTAHNVSW